MVTLKTDTPFSVALLRVLLDKALAHPNQSVVKYVITFCLEHYAYFSQVVEREYLLDALSNQELVRSIITKYLLNRQKTTLFQLL